MAKPKVFISSTYYDLRFVRNDLDRFIRDIGYEPILFEKGQVPYSKDQALETGCYKEIDNCDIVITVIGGRYGTSSIDQQHSITHKELKTAIELGKQIYVFVVKAVFNEYNTYQANKDLTGFKPVSVDNVKIFGLIEEIYSLPIGNPVAPFDTTEDIVSFLREQWAGLFQRMLQVSAREKEINALQNLETTAATLKQLVTFLTEERSKGDKAISEILLSSHPAFSALKKLLSIPYRVVFYTEEELDSLLSARSYKKDKSIQKGSYYEWDNDKDKKGVRITKSIFDSNGKLKVFTPEEWQDKWITSYIIEPEEEDDGIPF